MKLSFKLLETDSQIKRKVFEILQQQVNEIIVKIIPELNIKTTNLFIESIKKEPEYMSLKGGRLKAELGLPDSINIDELIDIIASSVYINKNISKITNQGINVGLKIEIFKQDGEPAISSDYAFVYDNLGGYSLPWLEWLLFKGTQSIVKNYRVQFENNRRSRSGMAVMVESSSDWSVPSEFAGTSNNNWITRALSRIDNELISIISHTLKSAT
jgi:hypothetical protein